MATLWAISDPTAVNATTDGFQTLTNAFVTADGGFEVVWSTAVADAGGNVQQVYDEQRFDPAAGKMGGETFVADPQALPSPPRQTEVVLADGSSVRLTGSPFGSLSAQLYDSANSPQGEPVVLAAGGFRGGWNDQAVLLPDQSIAVIWQGIDGAGPAEIFTSVLHRISGSSPIQGTSTGELLTGTSGDDVLMAHEGNDRVDGISGNDVIDACDGTDTAVFRTSLADVVSYRITNSVVTLTTALGVDSLRYVERVQFADALFALDTEAPHDSLPGGHVWQAAALFHAGFGVVPGRSDLSHWTAQADASGSMGELAQHMIDSYAPGISSYDLVAYLYQQLAHHAPTADVVQGFVDQIGPGKAFATQGDIAAYAANLSLNTDGLAGFVGTVQQLDPLAF